MSIFPLKLVDMDRDMNYFLLPEGQPNYPESVSIKSCFESCTDTAVDIFSKTDDKKNGRPVWNNLDKGMFLVFNGKMKL